ncbi:LysM peptidoglycan-binding domain-containing protein [Alkalimonas delamerensis]|uniref:LysM peptidoglycan-binding domain-containing protein n=1 Tax=Alkalimonas delamerensis TaxID=265981 RepID=A0ABT9GSN9_9GAMM|nr:LysM peptidoglycan-binding domain-containing protein [Alkalimonas delamerensis]MDP4529969.1 LysM peptidoglycan-binding domain-containing protein [Alkalimonas delamerensis]
MKVRVLTLVASTFLAGCATTNSLTTETEPVRETPSATKEQAANAELIAASLLQLKTTAKDNKPTPLDPTKVDDVWQRIQLQLTFEVPQHRAIAEQRNFFARNQTYLDRVATRAEPYLYYIVQQLEERNMPLELALLPIVESAFDPFAYSHARASGLWQFMPATGQRFGLQQNFWYDGRRDVIESTRAALDYLQFLHDRLEGDWLNAIAAYNSGEGRVLRAIRHNKSRNLPTDFWSLQLPRETTAYVPKLLALVDLVRQPETYGIAWQAIPNQPQIGIVDIGRQIDLAVAADLAGLTLNELHALNPAFNQWATDPDGNHRLVLPLDNKPQFREQLAKTPTDQWLSWQRHTVVRGDTLGAIARRYQTSVAAIQRLNDINGHTIRVGQHLLVPVSAKNADAYQLSQPGRVAQAQQRTPAEQRVHYTVKAGDTLWDISRAHQVSVANLARWNGMTARDPIRPGQQLVIVQSQGNTVPTASQGVTRTINYRVRRGDSLSRIAQRYRVRVADILEWNQLSLDQHLQPGQQLRLLVDVTQS